MRVEFTVKETVKTEVKGRKKPKEELKLRTVTGRVYRQIDRDRVWFLVQDDYEGRFFELPATECKEIDWTRDRNLMMDMAEL